MALGIRPDQGEEVLAERIEWLHGGAQERFPRLELNINLLAVVDEGGNLPDRVRQRIRSLYGVDLAASSVRDPHLWCRARRRRCASSLSGSGSGLGYPISRFRMTSWTPSPPSSND